MINFTFDLNDKPMSELKSSLRSFPAFSGKQRYVNERIYACLLHAGAIPPGKYYIFDRQSGGIGGWVRDSWSKYIKGNDRSEWFSLYAIDGKIDDETYCDQVERGSFRLHPGEGSDGCITLPSMEDFMLLRTMLRNTRQEKIEGVDWLSYGTVVVT